jgi:hypothetical protein
LPCWLHAWKNTAFKFKTSEATLWSSEDCITYVWLAHHHLLCPLSGNIHCESPQGTSAAPPGRKAGNHWTGRARMEVNFVSDDKGQYPLCSSYTWGTAERFLLIWLIPSSPEPYEEAACVPLFISRNKLKRAKLHGRPPHS